MSNLDKAPRKSKQHQQPMTSEFQSFSFYCFFLSPYAHSCSLQQIDDTMVLVSACYGSNYTGHQIATPCLCAPLCTAHLHEAAYKARTAKCSVLRAYVRELSSVVYSVILMYGHTDTDRDRLGAHKQGSTMRSSSCTVECCYYTVLSLKQARTCGTEVCTVATVPSFFAPTKILWRL